MKVGSEVNSPIGLCASSMPQASPIESWVFIGLVGPGVAGAKVTKLGLPRGPLGDHWGPPGLQNRCHSVPHHPGSLLTTWDGGWAGAVF